MDIRKTTANYRLSQWAKVVGDWQDSGKTIKDFCIDAGISRHAFFYWQRKLRVLACTELEAKAKGSISLQSTPPTGWMQLTAQTPTENLKDLLTVEVGGCQISVNFDTNPELLKMVLRTLRSL